MKMRMGVLALGASDVSDVDRQVPRYLHVLHGGRKSEAWTDR